MQSKINEWFQVKGREGEKVEAKIHLRKLWQEFNF